MDRKRVVDLTADELDRLAAEAWHEAARNALASGAPLVGRQGDKIVKIYPDGRTEILGSADLVDANEAALTDGEKNSERSIA
jgi:hypothetical protein